MIINLTKKTVVAKVPVSAATFADRGRGMICRDFNGFDAMVFNHCNCIHTMLMRINLDVIFVDSGNRVCDLREKLLPWKPLVRCGTASAVIELPEGAIRGSHTDVGDLLDLNAELTNETEKKLAGALMPVPETMMTPLNGRHKR